MYLYRSVRTATSARGLPDPLLVFVEHLRPPVSRRRAGDEGAQAASGDVGRRFDSAEVENGRADVDVQDHLRNSLTADGTPPDSAPAAARACFLVGEPLVDQVVLAEEEPVVARRTRRRVFSRAPVSSRACKTRPTASSALITQR